MCIVIRSRNEQFRGGAEEHVLLRLLGVALGRERVAQGEVRGSAEIQYWHRIPAQGERRWEIVASASKQV